MCTIQTVLLRTGEYVHQWLIHVDVWQKSNQYFEAIINQLKINIIKKQENKNSSYLTHSDFGFIGYTDKALF